MVHSVGFSSPIGSCLPLSAFGSNSSWIQTIIAELCPIRSSKCDYRHSFAQAASEYLEQIKEVVHYVARQDSK